MVGKRDFPELITPQEAAELCARYGTTECIERGRNIAEAVKQRETESGWNNDPYWIYYVSLGTIYEAGRIQGIREERLKKKERTFANG